MPLSRLEQLFEDGMTALRKERYNHAHDVFTEAMEIDPQLPQIHYNMGLAASHLYRWQDAVDCFTMALRIEPHPDAWVHLGIANLRLRNWEEALYDFERALELEPSSEVALMHRGDVAAFLAHGSRADDGCPLLCSGWYDERLADFVGVDPEIVPKARRRELRAYLRENMGDTCDHTHAVTEEWALRNGLDPLGLSRFLYSRGMTCDCRALAEPD